MRRGHGRGEELIVLDMKPDKNPGRGARVHPRPTKRQGACHMLRRADARTHRIHTHTRTGHYTEHILHLTSDLTLTEKLTEFPNLPRSHRRPFPNANPTRGRALPTPRTRPVTIPYYPKQPHHSPKTPTPLASSTAQTPPPTFPSPPSAHRRLPFNPLNLAQP